MHIGEKVITKYKGEIKEFFVIEMFYEDVKLKNGDLVIMRKYWEVRKPLK